MKLFRHKVELREYYRLYFYILILFASVQDGLHPSWYYTPLHEVLLYSDCIKLDVTPLHVNSGAGISERNNLFLAEDS